MSAAIEFRAILNKDINSIKRQMVSRCSRAANELRNASIEILRHAGSGRVYKLSGTHGKRRSKATKALMSEYGHKLKGGQLYRASAPGEPPALRFGKFYKSWQPTTICDGTSFISRIETNVNVNGHNLGGLLEHGTSKMAPRPHHDKIREKALPKIREIYSEPYF